MSLLILLTGTQRRQKERNTRKACTPMGASFESTDFVATYRSDTRTCARPIEPAHTHLDHRNMAVY